MITLRQKITSVFGWRPAPRADGGSTRLLDSKRTIPRSRGRTAHDRSSIRRQWRSVNQAGVPRNDQRPYTALRARSRDRSLMSVPRMSMRQLPGSGTARRHETASEYASSPVQQPALHRRSSRVVPARAATRRGRMTCSSASNAAGSRRKYVSLTVSASTTARRSAGDRLPSTILRASSPGSPRERLVAAASTPRSRSPARSSGKLRPTWEATAARTPASRVRSNTPLVMRRSPRRRRAPCPGPPRRPGTAGVPGPGPGPGRPGA